MKKFSMIAAAGALALATAAPVAAETQKVDADPFASTQSLGAGAAMGIAVGMAVLMVVVAGSDT